MRLHMIAEQEHQCFVLRAD